MNSVIKASLDCKDKRIDKALSNVLPDLSRNAIQKYIEKGNILVNDKIVTKNYVINENDYISISYDESSCEILPENIPLNIVFEDDDLLVVNKPRGMVVHPAPGNFSGTLVNALLYKYGDNLSHINGELRPGIVHRIDKDTSGLLIVAKNDKTHLALADMIKKHDFNREYSAVVCGHFKKINGLINAPIGRNPKDRKKMCVINENSKDALTYYSVIEEFDKYSLLNLKLETGRTHQIRVHMAHIGHPVAGDIVYGHDKKSEYLNGQCLHARKLGFVHPSSNKYIEINSTLPDYFKDFLRKISNGEYNGE